MVLSEARFIHICEGHPICDEHHGPGEFGRVGFAIGERVYFVGSYYLPGEPKGQYERLVEETRAIVDAINRGRTHPAAE